jgi:hypothetical protein
MKCFAFFVFAVNEKVIVEKKKLMFAVTKISDFAGSMVVILSYGNFCHLTP